ncbi:MAG: hypothetical protein HY403_12550 [Elusimicrobia bacterium]|nr:hypothetical protein [Elusimicrobiota bacterium]
MLRAAALFAALAVPAPPARAAAENADCAPLAGFGCYFVPENAPADAPLLVYLRGHHPVYGRGVPARLWLESARQAFEAYALNQTAREKRVVALVAYRSDLAMTAAVLDALTIKTGRVFTRTILAAHSGGYVGLGRTLDSGLTASRVLMLDDFYGADDDGLPQKLQRLISSGTACAGYYTPHNKANYDAGFKGRIQCAVDELDSDLQHNAAVRRCLGGYLDGRSCL